MNMRLLLLTLAIAALALSAAAQETQLTPGTLTDQRVIEMVRAGVRADQLAQIIAAAPQVSFDLSPAGTDALLKAGVTEDTIKAMAAREQTPPSATSAQPRTIPSSSQAAAPVIDASSEAVPQFTIFVGGSYFRVHSSGAEASQVLGVPDYLVQKRNLNFNLYGWQTTLTENVNGWFGVDVDASGNYGLPKPTFLCSASSASNALSCLSPNPVRPSVITKLHTFALGPRFSTRRYGRVVPFVHVLLGVGHISGSISGTSIFTQIPTLVPEETSRSNTALVVAPGLGLDLTVSHRLSVRLFEIDYMMTRFFNQRQDNARISAGFVFQFGRK
jgi:opacity protein-like surface antigen